MSNSLSPSDASSNWRSKNNSKSSPSPSFPGKKQRSPDNYHSRQQPAFHSSTTFEPPSRPFEQSNIKTELPAPKNEDYRENDTGALQAIEEGRRLYVGNLPYMAKQQDVQALFEGDGYTVFDTIILYSVLSITRLTESELISPSTLSRAGTSRIALSILRAGRKPIVP